MSREIMQQALDALKLGGLIKKTQVIAALEQELAKPEQEPVAWCSLNGCGEIGFFDGKPMIMVGKVGNDCHETPLYTSPPRKEWVGLTEDEVNLIYAEPQTHVGQYAKAIEAKLKEKNT
jgi:hypothetical protein